MKAMCSALLAASSMQLFPGVAFTFQSQTVPYCGNQWCVHSPTTEVSQGVL